MTDVCTICEGSGLRVIERPDGTRAAQECTCRAERRANKQISSARIPERYQHCTLDSFDVKFKGADESLGEALIIARNFVRGYPLDTNGNGLLLVGDVGVGKTHLAVAILRALVGKGVSGLFWDYRDLTKTIQHTYDRSVTTTEKDVLRPVFDAEVLVLDELGANKVTDWEWDTVAHILNTRYNDRRATIITTNYANIEAGKLPAGVKVLETPAGKSAQYSARKESLGDRIGDRMLSRLQEMCVVLQMNGKDFRKTVKKARFGGSERYLESGNFRPPVDDTRASFDDASNREGGNVASVLHVVRLSDEEEPVGRRRMGSYASPHQPPKA